MTNGAPIIKKYIPVSSSVPAIINYWELLEMKDMEGMNYSMEVGNKRSPKCKTFHGDDNDGDRKLEISLDIVSNKKDKCPHQSINKNKKFSMYKLFYQLIILECKETYLRIDSRIDSESNFQEKFDDINSDS